MQLVDVFMFNDEFSMLEKRLEYLFEHVDCFVLIEGDKTFGGNDKPYYFEENRDRYAKYLNKILNFKFVSSDRTFDLAFDPWQYEVAQRSYIGFCLDSFDADDILMIGDLDEIPNKDKLHEIKDTARRDEIALLHHEQFSYDLTTKCNSDGWFAAYAARKRIVLGHGPNKIRKSFGFHDVNLRGELTIKMVMNAGWHLQHFFSAEEISNKITNSCLLEFKTQDILDISRIQTCIENKTDLYNREKITYKQINPELYFPSDFLKIFTNNV